MGGGRGIGVEMRPANPQRINASRYDDAIPPARPDPAARSPPDSVLCMLSQVKAHRIAGTRYLQGIHGADLLHATAAGGGLLPWGRFSGA